MVSKKTKACQSFLPLSRILLLYLNKRTLKNIENKDHENVQKWTLTLFKPAVIYMIPPLWAEIGNLSYVKTKIKRSVFNNDELNFLQTNPSFLRMTHEPSAGNCMTKGLWLKTSCWVGGSSLHPTPLPPIPLTVIVNIAISQEQWEIIIFLHSEQRNWIRQPEWRPEQRSST